MCDFAIQQFPILDPIEFTLLNETQSFETQKKILVRIIMESRREIHKLRLLIIQDLHEKEMGGTDRVKNQPDFQENAQSEQTQDKMSDSRVERANKMTAFLEKLRIKVVEQEETILDFKRELQRLYAPKVY